MNGAAVRRPGRLITFEGGEGVGKSTQVARLARRLAERGVETVMTREPGGTPRAETLRRALLAGRAAPLGALGEAMLFTAARIDHVDALIAPALARGAFVLCDRFADSTRAYQGAQGRVEPELLAALERVALRGLAPDLTLILDLPVKEAQARAAARRGADAAPDRFEAEDGAYHEALRRAFLDIAAKEPGRCCVIDAAQSEDAAAEAIFSLVERRLLTEAAA